MIFNKNTLILDTIIIDFSTNLYDLSTIKFILRSQYYLNLKNNII
jgi:hypothetical protein